MMDRAALVRKALYDEYKKTIERREYKRYEQKVLTYTQTGADLVNDENQVAVGLRLTLDGYRLHARKSSFVSWAYWHARVVIVQIYIARIEAFIIGHGW